MPAVKLLPTGWSQPSGFEHGYAGYGRLLVTAGQLGTTSEGNLVPGGFLSQFEQALRNVLEIVAVGEGQAAEIIRLVVYLTDMEAYLTSRQQLGEIWRQLMGAHYPAMTVVEVKSLVRPEAIVELEATALLGE